MSSDAGSGFSGPRHALRDNHGAHEAIALSLRPTSPREPPRVPPLMTVEAHSFFAGAMAAYVDGDLAGSRLSLLAVVAIGDFETAPAAMVFLGVIAFRQRDFPEAYLWFSRASAGPDEHWALVADEELRRLA